MIRVCIYDGANLSRGGVELIATPLAENSSIWIDIQAEPKESEQVIFDQFGCHELTIQDARRLRHPPKTEHFDDQSFVLLRGLGAVSEGLAFETLQIACFIGGNFLITRHDEPFGTIDTWWNDRGLETSLAGGPFGLFASLSNSLGLEYLEFLLDFEPELSNYEDALLTSPNDNLLRELIACKTWLRKLKRLHSYHDRVFSQLLIHLDKKQRHASNIVHAVTDAYDKFDRLNSLSALYYDLAGDLIDGPSPLTS